MAVAARVHGDFGEKVKRAREERGVSLRQIADVTRISVRALEALERNDISRLPGGIFSRAFVRSYAAEIGLDPEQTVKEFLSHFPDDSLSAGTRHAAYDADDDEPRRRRLSGVAITVIVVALIVGALVYVTTFGFR